MNDAGVRAGDWVIGWVGKVKGKLKLWDEHCP